MYIYKYIYKFRLTTSTSNNSSSCCSTNAISSLRVVLLLE